MREIAKATSNHAFNKIFQIIECLSASPLTMRLQDISTQIHLPPSTVLRYLNSLIEGGYAYQDKESLRYGLTWRLLRISDRIKDTLGIRSIASTLFNELSAELGLGACLVIDKNGSCFYLDCVTDPKLQETTLKYIGKSSPLHATGSGKVLLTQYSEPKLASLIKQKGLAKLTKNTITDAEKLEDELTRIRKQGYAIDDEECEMGLRCVSVPIYDYTRQVFAAASVFGPTGIMTKEHIMEIVLPRLKETATELSFRLGFDMNE